MQDNPQDEIAIDEPRRAKATLVQEPRDVELDEPRQSAQMARREPEEAKQQRPQIAQASQAVVSFDRSVMRHSESIGQLAAAMAQAQGKFSTVNKTEEAKIKGKSRSGADVQYSYKYETLADVLEVIRVPMSEAGIAYFQFPYTSRETFTVRTMLVHSSGEWLYNDLVANLISLAPQDVGNAASYLRRYALKSIVGLAADYDDTTDGAPMQERDYRDEPPRPAAQRRQTREQPAPTPAKKEPPDQTQSVAQPEPNGEVHEVVPIGTSGAVVVRLRTGFQAATKDPELIEAAKRLKPGDRVELSADAPKNPNNHKILREIAPLLS